MERSDRGTDNIGGHDDHSDRIGGPGNDAHHMRRTILVVRARLGCLALLSAWACDTSDMAASPRGATAPDSAEQILYGGRTVLAYNGLRRGDVVGDTVVSYDALTRFEFHGMRAQFTTALGRPLSTLAAPSGTYRIASGSIEARGRVTITSDTTRRRLDGTAVRFDVATNQLASDSPFVATAGTRRLTGVGFTADPGLFTVKCVKSCTGSLGP